MTLVNVPITIPAPIYWERYVTNSLVPNAELYAQLNGAANFILSHRRKLLFSIPGKTSIPVVSIPSGERTRWRHYFRTGTLAARIRVDMILGRGAGTDPYGKYVLKTAAGATVGEITMHFGADNSNTEIVASDCGRFSGTIDVNANEEYYGEFLDVAAVGIVASPSAQLVSACVVEETEMPSLDLGWLNPHTGVTTPLYERHRRELFQLSTLIYKEMGSHLLSWSVDSDLDAVTFSSMSPVNVFDGTSGAPSAATPGPIWDLRYCNTLSRSTVAAVFAVFAEMPTIGGGAAHVELVDSTGTVKGSVSFEEEGPLWKTTTLALDAIEEKYDIRAYTEDGFTFTVYAVSAFQYLA